MKIKYNKPRQKFKIIILEIQNLTTKLAYFDSKKSTFKGTPYFLSVDGDTLSFEMPSKSCQVGHHLEVLLVSQPAPSVELRVTGKVIEIEDLKNAQKIDVKLMQYDKALLQSFQNLFLNEQKRVRDLFNALKGEEESSSNDDSSGEVKG